MSIKLIDRAQTIDLIAVISARNAKSRAQLTPMRTPVAYRGTKHCFMLDYYLIANALFGLYTPTQLSSSSQAYIKMIRLIHKKFFRLQWCALA